jgi:O-antigen/teichoic acid export membrane protein
MSLTKQSLLLSLGRSSASMARLLVNLGVARLFGERLEIAAEYQNLWLVFNSTYMLFIFSLPSVLFYFHPRLDAPGRRYLMSLVHQILLVLGAGYGAMMWLGAPWLADFYHMSPAAVGHLRVFAVYSFAMVGSAAMESTFNLLGRFKLLAVWMSVESLLFLALALGPLVAGAHPQLAQTPAAWLGALWPALSTEAASIRAVCWLLSGMALLKWAVFQGVLARYPDMAWHPVRFDSTRVKPLMSYALPITATTLVAYLAMYMDKNIVAAWFTDKSIYAKFQAGALEVPFVSVLVGSVSVVMLPHLSRLQHEGKLAEMADLLAEGVEKVAWLVFPIFTLLMVLADPLYVTFWGPAYAEAALPFRLYLLLFPMRLMFYGQVLNNLGMQRWVLGTAAGDLLLNFVLAITLVRFHWAGPAVATVFATLAEVGVFWWLLKRGLGQPLSRVFVPARLWRIARYSLLAGLAAVAGRVAGGNPLESIALGTVLHGGTYGALAWRAGLGVRVRDWWRQRAEARRTPR